jgi:hypothetical protein
VTWYVLVTVDPAFTVSVPTAVLIKVEVMVDCPPPRSVEVVVSVIVPAAEVDVTSDY